MNYQLTAIGLGPGDPELITLKGLRALQAADYIFVPQSKTGDQSLALRIAQPHIDTERQQVITLPLPMTRNSQELVAAWQAAAETIWQTFDNDTSSSQTVHAVYPMLGDPLLYGTFTYIWSELVERHPGIAVNVIPGITSFAATAAAAELPLSATSDRVVILPASYETDGAALKELLTNFETVILMKVGPVLPQLLEVLEELGLLENAVYAEKVGMPEERIVMDVSQLPRKAMPYLSLLIVRTR